jgi:hypothetical protein
MPTEATTAHINLATAPVSIGAIFFVGTHAFGVQKMHIFAANFCYKILRSLRNNKKMHRFFLIEKSASKILIID